MPTPVQEIRARDLAKFSELQGGRKLRDAEYFHSTQYLAAGQNSLEFFRVNGKQQDYSGAVVTIVDISNMVTSGKFDEPFLITHIGVCFIPATTGGDTMITDTLNVMNSGKLTLEINNAPVFERSPIGRCGSVTNFNGALMGVNSTNLYGTVSNGLRPHALDPMFFCEENITVRATMQWTTKVTISAASWIGVYLIGGKYFKA